MLGTWLIIVSVFRHENKYFLHLRDPIREKTLFDKVLKVGEANVSIGGALFIIEIVINGVSC